MRERKRSAAQGENKTGHRDYAIDYLRTFLIVLVVLLHAALAYTTFSTYNRVNWVESSAPVVDFQRWPILDPFVLYFDTFLMPLMFLISGLFTLTSLEHQGSRDFIITRLKRLGIPFMVGALVIAPLAFYPSYKLAAAGSHTPYLFRFFTTDGWPVGPPWFLWMLLLFDALAAFIYKVKPAILTRKYKSPSAIVVFIVTVLAFLPLSLVQDSYWWVSFGPFDFQPIRLGLYLAYFIMGLVIGSGRAWQGAGWPKGWGVSFILGVLSFIIYLLFMGGMVRLPITETRIIRGIAFSLSCAGSSLGLLGVFRKIVRRDNQFFNSLSANSYGIYLIHYAFVLWIQYALLFVHFPVIGKFILVFFTSLLLSWGTSRLFRRIPAVRRLI